MNLERIFSELTKKLNQLSRRIRRLEKSAGIIGETLPVVQLEPLLFSFSANGSQIVEIDYAATYGSSADNGTGGGTFSVEVNSSSVSVPFSVSAGDNLTVILSGATGTILRGFTLRRTA